MTQPKTAIPPPMISGNSIGEFTGIKQLQFFDALKRPRFSGQVIIKNAKHEEWTLYFYLGHLMYATGGYHAIRRWRRNLAIHCPEIDVLQLSTDLIGTRLPTVYGNVSWEYQLLCLWVERQQITYDQASKLIRAVFLEVLFDITKSLAISYQVKPDKTLSAKIILADIEQTIEDVQRSWKLWQQAKIVDRSPNSAPTICHPEQLRQHVSSQSYQRLTHLLDGQTTLRDLAIKMKRDLIFVIHSLLPFIQLGLIELTDIPDLPTPVTPAVPTLGSGSPTPTPLIACVDDSHSVCQLMDRIVTGAGYRFCGVEDPMRAIAILLARKPDIIFLDLVMPNVNGYEICGQLRKLSIFRKTPIIILTGNDGLVDRVRAKLVGSSDFLSKPVEQEAVLDAVHKYLKQPTTPG